MCLEGCVLLWLFVGFVWLLLCYFDQLEKRSEIEEELKNIRAKILSHIKKREIDEKAKKGKHVE